MAAGILQQDFEPASIYAREFPTDFRRLPGGEAGDEKLNAPAGYFCEGKFTFCREVFDPRVEFIGELDLRAYHDGRFTAQ